MEDLGAPFLELSYYVARVPERETYIRLVSALEDMGAALAGVGYAHMGPGIRDKPFGSITEESAQQVAASSLAAVRGLLDSPDVRLIRINMIGAVDETRRLKEVVTLQSISDGAAVVDRHPIAVWTEGELFSGEMRYLHAQRAWQLGQRAYRRFLQIVTALRPAYGAITVDYPLECPIDLRQRGGSLAFSNFYVARDFAGDPIFERIREVASDGYVEAVGDGLYASRTSEFNPAGLEAPDDGTRSYQIANLIAQGSAASPI
jgi:hypothetical protein